MNKKDKHIISSKEMAIFSKKFSDVLILQLSEIRAEMEQAVKELMSSINDLSQETSSSAKAATENLENIYLDPDENSQELLTAIQSSVDDVLESFSKDSGGHASNEGKSAAIDNLLRRFGGRFSKHMEAVSQIDSDVGGIIYDMVSHLSIDDLLRQKIEHVSFGIVELQKGLADILVNFEDNFNSSAIENMKENILQKLYNSYAAEDEKEIFKKHFK